MARRLSAIILLLKRYKTYRRMRRGTATTANQKALVLGQMETLKSLPLVRKIKLMEYKWNMRIFRYV